MKLNLQTVTDGLSIQTRFSCWTTNLLRFFFTTPFDIFSIYVHEKYFNYIHIFIKSNKALII